VREMRSAEEAGIRMVTARRQL